MSSTVYLLFSIVFQNLNCKNLFVFLLKIVSPVKKSLAFGEDILILNTIIFCIKDFQKKKQVKSYKQLIAGNLEKHRKFGGDKNTSKQFFPRLAKIKIEKC